MSREVRIDLQQYTNTSSLHEALATALGFPDYHGNNWDAFDECICDTGVSGVPCVLVLSNVSALEMRLPREAALLRCCLDNAVRERPGFSYRLEGHTG